MKENLERFAAGSVIKSMPGLTAFPVKQASELFEYAREYLTKNDIAAPYTIYDPCCGGAYLLTVLGLRYFADIRNIIYSDIDPNALSIASDNLYLLTHAGIQNRIGILEGFVTSYGKESHQKAVAYAKDFQRAALEAGKEIPSSMHHYDLLGDKPFPQEARQANIVIADIPYGKKSHWQSSAGIENPTEKAVLRISENIADTALLIVAMPRTIKLEIESFLRLKTFKFGTRKVLILKRHA